MASKSIRKSLESMILSGILIGAVNFAAQIYFARTLGIAVIGDYATLVVGINLLSIFVAFGFNQSVIGLGFTVRRFQNSLALTFIRAIASAVILAVAAAIMIFTAPDTIARLWLPGIVMYVGSVPLLLAYCFNEKMESELQYDRLAMMRAVSFLLANLMGVFLSLFHFGLYAIVGRDVLNSIIFFIMSAMALTVRPRPRLDRPIAYALTRYSFNIWLNLLSSEGVKRLDYALVRLFVSPTVFAIYFQTRNLFEGGLAIITYPIQSTLFSYFRKFRAEMNFARFLTRVCVISFGAWVVGIGIFALAGSGILTLLFGKQWASGSQIMAPIWTYICIVVFFEVLVSIGKALNYMGPILIGRAVNLVLIAALVPLFAFHFGMRGAGWATAIGAVLMLAVVMSVFFKRIAKRGLLSVVSSSIENLTGRIG